MVIRLSETRISAAGDASPSVCGVISACTSSPSRNLPVPCSSQSRCLQPLARNMPQRLFAFQEFQPLSCSFVWETAVWHHRSLFASSGAVVDSRPFVHVKLRQAGVASPVSNVLPDFSLTSIVHFVAHCGFGQPQMSGSGLCHGCFPD